MIYYLDAIIILALSYFLLYTQRKKFKTYSKVSLEIEEEELIRLFGAQFNLPFGYEQIKADLRLNNPAGKLGGGLISLDEWLRIVTYLIFLNQFRSLVWPKRIMWLLERLHLLIVTGLFFSIASLDIFLDSFGIFISLALALFLFYKSWTTRNANVASFRRLVASLPEKDTKFKEVALMGESQVIFFYPISSLAIPGKAIQWIIDLFRPGAPS